MKKYKVTLTETEVSLLNEIARKGKRNAMIIRNAYVLLNSNQSPGGKKQKDEDIAKNSRWLGSISWASLGEKPKYS